MRMNAVRMKTAGIVMVGMVSLAASAWAGDEVRHTHGQHMHGPMHGADAHEMMKMDHDAMMKGAWMKTKDVDGYRVTFHIMEAMEGMAHGGSHNLMVKVEKDGVVVRDLLVNSKVIHPNEKSESKMLMKMGDWFMAGYDLDHSGDHQVMVLFKSADGSKHFTGVHYPGGK